MHTCGRIWLDKDGDVRNVFLGFAFPRRRLFNQPSCEAKWGFKAWCIWSIVCLLGAWLWSQSHMIHWLGCSQLSLNFASTQKSRCLRLRAHDSQSWRANRWWHLLTRSFWFSNYLLLILVCGLIILFSGCRFGLTRLLTLTFVPITDITSRIILIWVGCPVRVQWVHCCGCVGTCGATLSTGIALIRLSHV